MIFYRPIVCLLLSLLLLLPALPAAQAAEDAAERIPGREFLTAWEGASDLSRLFDGNELQATTLPNDACLTFRKPGGIGSAYLIFDTEPGSYTVTDPEKDITHTFGEEGFLHEFLDFEGVFGYAPEALTFLFPSGEVRINELTLFTPGEVPDCVQKWKAPKEGETDLILFSAHGDDEHLFFAGLLPDYAGERGYETLVVYLTNHRNRGTVRCHEMLNGLWSVGVTTYPVFGTFGDYFCHRAQQALAIHQRNGQSEEALLGFVVEQLRRYRPQVVVGHDINGEYGHGQHAMFAALLCRGVEAAEAPDSFPGLTDRYGTWQVPKTYLHLWEENPITLDLDQPLSRFDGMTAFQVSKTLGFGCHKSQVGGVTQWITAYDLASDIPRYSPCQYGLYRTTVGPDTGEQDLFENLTSYRQQQVMAAFAKNQENSLNALQTARDFAVTRQHIREQQEEVALHQRRAEALVRREARLRRRASVAVFTVIAACSLSVFVLRRKKKK